MNITPKKQNADERPKQTIPTATGPTEAGKHLRFWSFAAGAAIADVITKYLAWKYLGPPQDNAQWKIIPGWLELTTSENTGAIFGLGQGYSWLFVVMSAAAGVLLIWLFTTSRADQRMFHVWLGLILGGTLGNLYDRICFGYVRDFIRLHERLWPYVFNLADVFLVIGVAGAIIAWLAHHKVKTAESN